VVSFVNNIIPCSDLILLSAKSVTISNDSICTSRHFFHKNLDEAILTDRAQVLDNVPVFKPLVQSYLLMEGLGVSV